MPDNRKYGHWQPCCNIDTIKQFGFIYIITNNINGRKYVGRKQYRFKRGKKEKESDWKQYTGSSNTLNADIIKYGKDKFTFEIIEECLSKSTLTYKEAKYIIMNDVIYNKQWYNEFINLKLRIRK